MSYTREDYYARKESGRCVVTGCKDLQSETSLRCDRHNKQRSITHANWLAKLPAGWNAKRHKNRRGSFAFKNLCRRCGSSKLHSAKHCLPCLKYIRDYNDKTRGPVTRKFVCSICKSNEPRRHVRTTCPNIAKVELARFIAEKKGEST